MENQDQTFEVMRACLLAGKIMLQSGAETYRVEDTMSRMASAFGISNTHSYVTPTGIIFSVEGIGPERTKLVRILDRTTDLRKVAMVNSISRKISSGEIGLVEACGLLAELEKANLSYSFYTQLAAAAIASGCFTIMFNGSWLDFLPSMAAGGIGYFLVVYFHRIVPVKFFAEFLSSFFIGMVSFFFIKFGLGQELDKIIIGSVMPLVPGLLITNAVRDLMAGHLVSGLSKGAEALLTAFAIGSGIAAILSFL
ncbi:threonine/serine exporter family protein [Heyndrickxia sp. MSNUG]|uniref:threonine/serine exporter family protein n=1 Tax=Heyndrickxia sp. MSNUG TaxID=3136677 RepID=UPI003C2FFC64